VLVEKKINCIIVDISVDKDNILIIDPLKSIILLGYDFNQNTLNIIAQTNE